jgi:beta-ureidopropionase / N-carbamoyl-L-amino-acid hydrolase
MLQPRGEMLTINEDRMLADLRALAEFGRAGTGVNRPAFSDADLAARGWLMAQMQSSGLETAIDGIGNVYGRSPEVAQSILLGSHSDSVPNGGWLDGALGVIYALEVARAARGTRGAIGIDVISFADEEGTWLPCLGSRSFCGQADERALHGVQTKSGVRLIDRLKALELRERPLARLDPDRHRAYLEAHIEQGPRLINEGIDVGIVGAIVGLRRHVVHFRGRADHAGTTPMAMRSDAAFAMFNFAIALAERLRAAGSPESVWNFGIVAVRPGAGNVVPAEADLTVEFRDAAAEVIERMEASFHAAVRAADGSHRVAVSSTPNAQLEPAAMDADLMNDLAAAAADVGASAIRMPSGAGHDAMILAPRVPSAMMFVPSIDGRSHDVSENTSEADIRRGLRVFAGAVSRTLARLGEAVAQAPHSLRRKEPAA